MTHLVPLLLIPPLLTLTTPPYRQIKAERRRKAAENEGYLRNSKTPYLP